MPLNESRIENSPVLVTGASGFIGSRIVRRLLERGREVVALVHTQATHPRLASAHDGLEIRDHLRVETVDLHDHEGAAALVATHAPFACIHAAWDVTPGHYLDSPENQTWVETSIRLHDALVHAGCHRLVVLGTCFEPADGEEPSCAYAAAKGQLRRRLLAAAHDSSTDLAWLRIFQPYGPGEHPDRFLPGLIRSTMTGEPFIVKSGDTVRDFVHVDDIAEAVARCLDRGLHGTFDVGTGRGRRLGDVALLIASRSDRPSRIQIAGAGTNAPASLVADPRPLHAACGWAPAIEFESAIDDLVHAGEGHDSRKVVA